MKKRHILILASNKNTQVQLINNEHTHTQTHGSINCMQNGKYLSWLYYNDNSHIAILIDPPPVEEKIVYAIEALDIQHFFIVLTGCHRRKKDHLITWVSLFPFTILSPQITMKEILISREHIIDDDSVHTLVYTENEKTFLIGHIIGSILSWYRTLLLYIPPYLFSGSIIQHHNTHHYPISSTMQNFIHTLPEDTIVLPELGGIHILHTKH